MIDFEHPRFEFMIQHYIEPQQIAAKIRLFCLAGPVKMSQLRLNNKKGLDNALFDLVPYLVRMLSISLSSRTSTHKFPLKDVLQSELMLFAVKFFIVFIERVISQVDIRVIE